MLESHDSNNKIALWGPTGTGKTWYILAFSRKLRDFKTDPDFSYKLYHGDQTIYDTLQDDQVVKSEIPILIKPDETSQIQPTRDLQDHIWTFKREKKKNTPSHTLSSFSHTIHIVDDKGEETVKLTSNATVFNLISANFIVMMLDPTKLSSIRGEVSATHTPLEYASMVENFFQTLNSAPLPQRHIAICINKIDQLHVKQREPQELVQMFFGKEMYHVLQDQINNRFILKLFAVSSMGFIKEGTNVTPNYDATTGKLMDPDNWKPYNVESPLFWLFESIERKKFKQDDNKGVFGKLLFQPERNKSYIPYPIKNK